MIVVTSPDARFNTDSSSLPSRAANLPASERTFSIDPAPGASPAADVVPGVVAVVIHAGLPGGEFAADPARAAQGVLDELCAVLERHFGNRVRIADRSVGAPLIGVVDSNPAARSALAEQPPLRFGRLTIDAARHEVLVDDRPAPLTKSEFDLLLVLARRPGVVHSRREIVVASKGPDYPVDDRSIDVQMFNLRRKLGPVGRRLQTVRSVGYRFVPEGT
jgi:hypothetical protein